VAGEARAMYLWNMLAKDVPEAQPKGQSSSSSSDRNWVGCLRALLGQQRMCHCCRVSA
jgi:hypothetical protein